MKENFMMSKKFYFDTYALVEISKGNPQFDKYKSNYMILSDLNLLEFYYYLIRVNKEDKIPEIFNELKKFLVIYDNDDLIKSAKMKFKHKQEKISFVDCIGYQLAKKHKARFLTGDEQFKNKENVEFVK